MKSEKNMKNLLQTTKQVAILLFCALALLCACNAKRAGMDHKDFAQRVVALTPSLAEATCALGYDGELVGASDYTRRGEYCSHYEALQSMPADLEAILLLKPDLVLLHPSERVLAQSLESRGVAVASWAMDSIGDIEEAMKGIAMRMGDSLVGESYVRDLHKGLDALQSRAWGLDELHVLLVVEAFGGRGNTFYIAQGESYLAQLVRLCGARILGQGDNAWQELDTEAMLGLEPDVVLHFAGEGVQREELLAHWRQRFALWGEKGGGRVIILDDPRLSLPGPRIVESAERLCEVLRGAQSAARD